MFSWENVQKAKSLAMQKDFYKAIEKAVRNENDSDKTFVNKYKEWTEKERFKISAVKKLKRHM